MKLKQWHHITIIIVMTVSVRLFGLISLIPLFGIGWILDNVLDIEEEGEEEG